MYLPTYYLGNAGMHTHHGRPRRRALCLHSTPPTMGCRFFSSLSGKVRAVSELSSGREGEGSAFEGTTVKRGGGNKNPVNGTSRIQEKASGRERGMEGLRRGV